MSIIKTLALPPLKLPEMTVEKRVSTNAWGIPEPDLSEENLARELQLAIQLNQDAHTAKWAKTTLEVIHDYSPDSPEDFEIVDSVKAIMNHDSWMDCVRFVQDDMCSDFFNRTLHYCLKEGQPHRKDKDFIDGSGIGYLGQYKNDLRVSLNKAFDVKYFYKVERPLEYALKRGMDFTRVANKIHPPHWSYIAGHGLKFFQSVATNDKMFHLDKKCKRYMRIAASAEAMARTGNLIHYPMDNNLGDKIAA